MERTDMETTGQLFIDGRWRDGDGTAFDSFDPATGDSLWQGRAANREDVHDAFTAARRAFDDWSDRGHGEREALLRAYAQTLAQRKDRSEEHTSELQSLMRISYAVFCLKK